MRGLFLTIAILLLAFSAFAGSLSELNVGGFENRQTASRTSGEQKSPFTESRQSSNDLLPEDLYLTGIAVGGAQNYALISGHVLSEGESIAGMTVKTIGKDKVILQKLDKVHTLYMSGGI